MREGPRDECGVFGLYAPGHEVSRLSYFALYALQHRGQESAGIAAADRGGHIITRRELGLVSQVFSENDLRTLAGELAIGHVRYSTTGSNAWENSQPVQRSEGTDGSRREVALAHNGNLINAVELHDELLERGVTFSSTSDSEIIAALIATHPAELLEDAIADVLPRLRGAFSIVAMTKDRVVAFRDPHGLRPLAHRRARARAGRSRRRPALLRGERVVRVRHHRREAPARGRAGRGGHARTATAFRAAGRGPGRQARLLRVRVHLLRAPGLAHERHACCRSRAGGWARSCGGRRRWRRTS